MGRRRQCLFILSYTYFAKKKYLLFEKDFLQTSLERIPLYLLLYGKFENLIVKSPFLYILNMHVTFHSNRMLFTIRSINSFFIHNFRLKKFEI